MLVALDDVSSARIISSDVVESSLFTCFPPKGIRLQPRVACTGYVNGLTFRQPIIYSAHGRNNLTRCQAYKDTRDLELNRLFRMTWPAWV